MIYNAMTEEQWMDWKARVDAYLMTDIKEYNHGVSLLMEAAADRSIVKQFQWGDPSRYISSLKNVLSRVRSLSNYPRLITKENPAKPLYMAEVPYHPEAQIPGTVASEPIEPLETPTSWNRYMKIDSYKDKLSPELRKESENVADWFANLKRLHELSKNQVKTGVSKEKIAVTVADLDAQKAAIDDFFNRVESYMTGKDKVSQETSKKPVDDSKPTGAFTKDEIEAMRAGNPVYAALCQEKRREANMKFITRKDLKRPKNQEELELRIRELQEWGYEVPQVDSSESDENEPEDE